MPVAENNSLLRNKGQLSLLCPQTTLLQAPYVSKRNTPAEYRQKTVVLEMLAGGVHTISRHVWFMISIPGYWALHIFPLEPWGDFLLATPYQAFLLAYLVPGMFPTKKIKWSPAVLPFEPACPKFEPSQVHARYTLFCLLVSFA